MNDATPLVESIYKLTNLLLVNKIPEEVCEDITSVLYEILDSYEEILLSMANAEKSLKRSVEVIVDITKQMNQLENENLQLTTFVDAIKNIPGFNC